MCGRLVHDLCQRVFTTAAKENVAGARFRVRCARGLFRTAAKIHAPAALPCPRCGEAVLRRTQLPARTIDSVTKASDQTFEPQNVFRPASVPEITGCRLHRIGGAQQLDRRARDIAQEPLQQHRLRHLRRAR